jgi:hypothetical protein
VTEADWLASDDPQAMLHYLQYAPVGVGGRLRGTSDGGPRLVSDRKLRLFAVACCHAVSDELGAEAEYCDELPRGPAKDAANWAMGWAGDQKTPTAAERAALLRCIVGSPFRPLRPVTPCADGPTCPQHGYPWLTPAVRSLAQAIHDGPPCPTCRGLGGGPFGRLPDGTRTHGGERCPDCRGSGRGLFDFAALPVLADCLEEAGCSDAAILAHCRGPGPHVRGCWCVDLLTGREG